jgi:hypothetical protein
MKAPGQRLRRLAVRLCDERTISTIIDPALADLQHEAEEARRAGDPRTRPSLARYAAVWQVLGYGIARSLVRGAASGLSRERELVNRTVIVAVAAGLAITVLLTLSPVLSIRPRAAEASPWLMLLFLLPQAAAIGIPIGLCYAIVFTMRSRPLTARVLGPMTALALLASGLTVAMLEWLVPEANQAFRTLMAGGHVVRGLHEVGLTTLARRSDTASILALHVRLSLAATTFTLTAPGLALISLFRPRAWAAALIGLVGPAAYFACAWTLANRFGQGAPILAAWAPSLLLVALAAAPLRAAWRKPASISSEPTSTTFEGR